MIDERHEEAAALYALDLLEGAERVSFEAELAKNPELRAFADQLRSTGARLAHVAPSVAPSPFLRERVLASARARASRPRRWPAMVGWGVAACFAVGAGILARQTVQLKQAVAEQQVAAKRAQTEAAANAAALERERQEMQRTAGALQIARADADKLRTALQDQGTQSARIIAALRSQANVAELKIQSLASLLGDTPKARAIAVWNPLTQEGVLTVANLPALEANKDYQLWLVEPQGDAPVDGGTFRVDPTTGEARVTFKPSRGVPTVDKFAVSLERKGGVPKREGPVVLLGQ